MKLSFKHISIDSGEKRIVSDASLSVASGEVHVLMGPNGSGKSTLLNGVMGYPKFTIADGKIEFDGEDITALPTEEKAKRGIFLSMQYLPEIPGVTLLNFLHKAHRAQKGEEISVLEFLKRVEAEAKAVGIDPGFLRRQVGVGLSGGEKKQAEILQMLALRPKFAFLDEIDSGVDVDALKLVVAGIERMKREGTGFILVTHYDTLLSHIAPDHVHVMREGKIVASGGRELSERIAKEGFANI